MYPASEKCRVVTFDENDAYEIKSIDCFLKPEFVLLHIEYFENVSIALLWYTK